MNGETKHKTEEGEKAKKKKIEMLIHSDLERKTVSEGGEVNQRTTYTHLNEII